MLETTQFYKSKLNILKAVKRRTLIPCCLLVTHHTNVGLIYTLPILFIRA